MYSRQKNMRFLFGCGEIEPYVAIALLRQAAVGSPSIGVHRRAGLDCLNDETGQGLP
jgi:hypothetical protein